MHDLVIRGATAVDRHDPITLGPTRVRHPRQPQGSLLTPRWSKPDSNLSSLRRPKIKWSNPEPGRSRR